MFKLANEVPLNDYFNKRLAKYMAEHNQNEITFDNVKAVGAKLTSEVISIYISIATNETNQNVLEHNLVQVALWVARKTPEIVGRMHSELIAKYVEN